MSSFSASCSQEQPVWGSAKPRKKKIIGRLVLRLVWGLVRATAAVVWAWVWILVPSLAGYSESAFRELKKEIDNALAETRMAQEYTFNSPSVALVAQQDGQKRATSASKVTFLPDSKDCLAQATTRNADCLHRRRIRVAPTQAATRAKHQKSLSTTNTVIPDRVNSNDLRMISPATFDNSSKQNTHTIPLSSSSSPHLPSDCLLSQNSSAGNNVDLVSGNCALRDPLSPHDSHRNRTPAMGSRPLLQPDSTEHILGVDPLDLFLPQTTPASQPLAIYHDIIPTNHHYNTQNHLLGDDDETIVLSSKPPLQNSGPHTLNIHTQPKVSLKPKPNAQNPDCSLQNEHREETPSAVAASFVTSSVFLAPTPQSSSLGKTASAIKPSSTTPPIPQSMAQLFMPPSHDPLAPVMNARSDHYWTCPMPTVGGGTICVPVAAALPRTFRRTGPSSLSSVITNKPRAQSISNSSIGSPIEPQEEEEQQKEMDKRKEFSQKRSLPSPSPLYKAPRMCASTSALRPRTVSGPRGEEENDDELLALFRQKRQNSIQNLQESESFSQKDFVPSPSRVDDSLIGHSLKTSPSAQSLKFLRNMEFFEELQEQTRAARQERVAAAAAFNEARRQMGPDALAKHREMLVIRNKLSLCEAEHILGVKRIIS